MLEREPTSPIGIGVRQLLLASTVPRESAPPPSRTSNLRRTEGVSRAFVYHTQQGPRGSKRHGESQGSSHAGTSTGFARRGDTQTRAARRGTCLTGLFDPLMRPRPPPGLRHANRRGGVPALSGTRAVGARGSCSSVPCTVPVQ